MFTSDEGQQRNIFKLVELMIMSAPPWLLRFVFRQLETMEFTCVDGSPRGNMDHSFTLRALTHLQLIVRGVVRRQRQPYRSRMRRWGTRASDQVLLALFPSSPHDKAVYQPDEKRTLLELHVGQVPTLVAFDCDSGIHSCLVVRSPYWMKGKRVAWSSDVDNHKVYSLRDYMGQGSEHMDYERGGNSGSKKQM